MHDIDRTHLETGWKNSQLGEYESAYADEFAGEYEENAAYEFTGMDVSEYEGIEGMLDESEEMELAAELLEVTDEAELDQFFGKLFRKAKNKLGKPLSSAAGITLINGLKGVARQALPRVGQVVGGFVGGPLGGMIGGQLAQKGGQIFGLEMEGLSLEDQEFEIARRVVRLAKDAVRNTVAAPVSLPAEIAAKRAVVHAIKQHAPSLLPNRLPAVRTLTNSTSGRWIRQGKHVILFNVYES